MLTKDCACFIRLSVDTAFQSKKLWKKFCQTHLCQQNSEFSQTFNKRLKGWSFVFPHKTHPNTFFFWPEIADWVAQLCLKDTEKWTQHNGNTDWSAKPEENFYAFRNPSILSASWKRKTCVWGFNPTNAIGLTIINSSVDNQFQWTWSMLLAYWRLQQDRFRIFNDRKLFNL